MFTGIIQSLGRVASLERRGPGARLAVAGAAPLLRRLKRGDSIAVNGVCLTVVGKRAGTFTADLAAETLARTTLGALARGARVNLEPPLRLGDMLSGHILQGHVEATGTITALKPVAPSAKTPDGGWWLDLAVPPEIARYLAPKGSIAVDGISLTVAALKPKSVRIAIIPHTYSATNLRHLNPGAPVNLETDPMARHLEQLLEARLATPRPKKPLSVAALRKLGF